MIKQDKHISCVCVSKGEYELINIFRSISLYVYNILKQYLAISLIIVISDIIIIYLQWRRSVLKRWGARNPNQIFQSALCVGHLQRKTSLQCQ